MITVDDFIISFLHVASSFWLLSRKMSRGNLHRSLNATIPLQHGHGFRTRPHAHLTGSTHAELCVYLLMSRQNLIISYLERERNWSSSICDTLGLRPQDLNDFWNFFQLTAWWTECNWSLRVVDKTKWSIAVASHLSGITSCAPRRNWGALWLEIVTS